MGKESSRTWSPRARSAGYRNRSRFWPPCSRTARPIASRRSTWCGYGPMVAACLTNGTDPHAVANEIAKAEGEKLAFLRRSKSRGTATERPRDLAHAKGTARAGGKPRHVNFRKRWAILPALADVRIDGVHGLWASFCGFTPGVGGRFLPSMETQTEEFDRDHSDGKPMPLPII